MGYLSNALCVHVWLVLVWCNTQCISEQYIISQFTPYEYVHPWCWLKNSHLICGWSFSKKVLNSYHFSLEGGVWARLVHRSVFLASFPALPTVQLVAYKKTKGGGLVHFIMWMTYLPGRQRGGRVPNQKNTFHTRILCFEPEAVCFSLCKHLKLKRLGQRLQNKASSLFFQSGTPPPLCLPS